MTKTKVWFSPVCNYACEAVAMKRWWGWSIIYRDLDGKCRRTHEYSILPIDLICAYALR